jgi:hypothetical protein
VILDAYPVADGHTLIVPRKHVSTIYELSDAERKALWKLVGEVRERLLTGLRPDGSTSASMTASRLARRCRTRTSTSFRGAMAMLPIPAGASGGWSRATRRTGTKNSRAAHF